MGIIFVVIAAIFAAGSNYFLRRGIDAKGSSTAVLTIQLSSSFLLMVLLNPVRMGDFEFATLPIVLGLIGGAILGSFFWALGKSFETGPAGVTVAIISSSCVMPSVILALLFGAAFGHTYTLTNALGGVLVLMGILWAGLTSVKTEKRRAWSFFSSQSFLLHTLFLVYLQWWAMLLNEQLPLKAILPFHINTPHVQWFMPSIFFMAALFQWVIFLRSSPRKRLTRGEFTFGAISGISNGLCAFFLILAPQVAAHWQNAMLFPIYSVGIVILCNLWSQLLYKERVNWKANSLCMAGLVIGTIALT